MGLKQDLETIRTATRQVLDDCNMEAGNAGIEPAAALADVPYKLRDMYIAGYIEGQQAGGGGDYSNIPTVEKTVTGSVLNLDDVSEVPHKCTVSVDADSTVWIGGKNLINHKTATLRDGKTPLVYTEDGVIWKAGNTYYFYIFFDVPIPAGEKIYCNWQSEKDSKGNDVRYWSLLDHKNSAVTGSEGPGTPITTPVPVYGIRLGKIRGDVPVAEDLLISNISVTFDGLPYAPYDGRAYTVAQGQPIQVDSRCIDMALYSGNGAAITVDYHRSYGIQVVEDRQNAVTLEL